MMNVVIFYILIQWVTVMMAFINLRTAYTRLIMEESKYDRCPKVMKFLVVSIPMMFFFAFMIIKTTIMHGNVNDSSSLTLMHCLWAIADFNIVLWVHYGLKLVGEN